MGDLASKRVYDQRATRQLVFAGTGMGIAVIETAGDSIGRFRLVRDCEARDLAGGGGWVVVATPEDVLACEVDADGEGEWIETGFGPAVAVGIDQGDFVAAGPDGELGRVVDAPSDPTDWLAVADVDGDVRAMDGPLVGASDGVYQFTADGLFDVGLDDVRDVSATGVPLAATGDGLFRLGNGWLRELDGAVEVVTGTDRPTVDGDPAADDSADGRSGSDDPTSREPDDGEPGGGEPGGGELGGGEPGANDGEAGAGGDPLARGHAATSEQLYAYVGGHARERTRGDDPRSRDDDPAEDDGRTGDEPTDDHEAGDSVEADEGAPPEASDPVETGEEIVSAAVAARAWRERSTPVGPIVAVAYGQQTYALAADGTFLIDRGDEWATRATGLPDAVALATPE